MVIRKYYDKDKPQLATFPCFGKSMNHIDLSDYSYSYVAVMNRQVVGYLFAGRAEGNAVILWEIEVLPEYRHQGVAKKLHNKLTRDMLHCGEKNIMLFFNRDSTLDQFYQKLGYVVGNNLVVANKDIF